MADLKTKAAPLPGGLPRRASIITCDCDVRTPEKIPVLSKLPRLSQTPPDWTVFILHILYHQTGLATTLPLLWEQETGRQWERLIVSNDIPFCLFPRKPMRGFMADVMPLESAVAFSAWLDSKLFIRSKHRWYAEVEMKATVLPGVPNPAQAPFLSTTEGRYAPQAGLPVTYKDSSADYNLLTRANIVLTDPSVILKLDYSADDVQEFYREHKDKNIQG